jgi:hypothetical protein
MAFLYSINTGEFVVREGIIHISANPVMKLDETIPDNDLQNRERIKLAKFFIKNDNYRVLVAQEPGVVYHRLVWLEERNDTIAKNLLVNNEFMKIKLLKKDIVKHRNIINMLGYVGGDWYD